MRSTRSVLVFSLLSLCAAAVLEAQLPALLEKRGLTVEIQELARLPDTRGVRPPDQDTKPAGWARVSYVRDLPDGRRFVNDSRGYLYLLGADGRTTVYADFAAVFPFANYTRLWTEGDYGDLGNVQRTGELAGFKPRAANAGISYIRGKLNLRAIYNYNGRMLFVTNARDNLKQYRIPEERVDLKLKYIINERLDVYLDVYNVFNSKYGIEYGSFERPRQLHNRHDPQFHFGINGRL